MTSGEEATIVFDLTTEIEQVKDERYQKLVNELSTGIGPEEEAGGTVLAFVVQYTNIISSGDVDGKFDTAVRAWSTACEGVNKSWSGLSAFSQTCSNAAVKELAKRLHHALKTERLQIQGQIDECRSKLAQQLERARTRRHHASSLPAARTLPGSQGQVGRVHYEIPFQRTSEILTRGEQGGRATHNQAAKITNIIPPSGPRRPILPGGKTCFFYCGHGGCKRTPAECTFLHKMTDPLVIADPPPKYRHPSKDCGISACPVMMTRKREQAHTQVAPTLGAESAVNHRSPHGLQEDIAALSTSDPRSGTYNPLQTQPGKAFQAPIHQFTANHHDTQPLVDPRTAPSRQAPRGSVPAATVRSATGMITSTQRPSSVSGQTTTAPRHPHDTILPSRVLSLLSRESGLRWQRPLHPLPADRRQVRLPL
ncbi:hypothetical protein LTR86_000600 [Recurvomyces mirabilis]|nr:hypothetical protein LTR86_000600 [Recurvomyces mirabilis]